MTKTKEKSLYSVWFVVPSLAIFLIFFLWPVVSSLYYSMTVWNFETATFNALENYKLFFTDPAMSTSVPHTLLYAFAICALKVVLAFFIAIFLTSPIKTKGFIRSAVFFPNLVWRTGTHYADWLALDGSYPGGVFGATDPNLIASGYYCYSARIVAKAARILGKLDDAEYYGRLADEVRDAFRREYFTPTGRLAVDTMTAHVVALYMDLTPPEALERTRQGLLNRLQKNFYHLETGFVGTPYLCRVLSENGMNGIAYHLLMEKGYPGWLYEVLMGATTVWERWNSVEPDGRISGTEMNSLNHYAYGSIVEWMFRDMCGINPMEDGAGFKRFTLAPKPDYRIGSAEATLDSAAGRIESAWRLEDGRLSYRFVIPFDSTAEITLPDADADAIRGQFDGDLRQVGKDVALTAGPGEYRFEYAPTTPCRRTYSLDSSWADVKQNPEALAVAMREFRFKEDHIPFENELCTLREMSWAPFTDIPQERRDRLDLLLRAIE